MKAGTFRGIVAPNGFRVCRIPTMRELGYQESCSTSVQLLAPAGIPEEARKALVGAIEQAVKAPGHHGEARAARIVQSYAAAEQMAAEIRED